MSRNLKRTQQMRQRSRSRSVTPGPSGEREGLARRQLIMSKVEDRDPFLEPEPKLWKPSLNIGFNVQNTPGGSIRVTERVELLNTPGGSVKYKTALQESIHVSAIERAAACGIDEEEGSSVMEEDSRHITKWLSELVPPETPTPEPGTTRALSVDQSQPGTSGTQKQPAPMSVERNEGSEFDSDFDDEYNLDELTATGVMARDIPDDDVLEEPTRVLVDSVERAMDDAIDHVIGVCSGFSWQSDYDTFSGIPEVFTGPTPGPRKDYDTPYDAFIDIWDKSIMEHIVTETNRYAKQVIEKKKETGTLKPNSRLHRWTDTDVDEMYLFFAILIYMGIASRSSQHEYWKTSGILEMPKFRQLLSFNRFILLNKFIHFADNCGIQNHNYPQNLGMSTKLNKLAPVLVHLNSKFESLYNLSNDIAIDESLTLFKGRLSWVQAIRSKAARFGIKSYELCESRTGYLSKFNIYAGKNSGRNDVVSPSVALAGKSTQIVLELLKGLERRGHCVTMDNFYNCPALARYLKTLGFDCLGTLRVNRKNVPTDIAQVSKNVPKGTIIARHSGDVSCIAWKDTKMVTMISTYHKPETHVGQKAGRELIKPNAVRDYNNTMGGVDLKDQKLSMYLVERKRCVKWYMKIFKRLLNVSVHNALVMLLESRKRRNMSEITHRDFRECLANSLVEKHRCSLQAISLPVEETMRLRTDIMHVPSYLESKYRMLCHICLRKGIRKRVHLKCKTCDEAMCHESCWVEWHSLQELPGNVHVRKARRRV